MSWVIDLIDRIPDLLTYLIPGYIFISLFDFIIFKNEKGNKNQANFIVLKSIAISYVFKTVYDKILNTFFSKFNIDDLLYTIILFVIIIIFAYILGLICHTKWFNNLLLKIGIHRTVNEDIWLDIIYDGCYLQIFSKDGTKSYFGMCKYHEENSKEPIVVLYKYKVLDSEANIIQDYSNDETRQVVLNLKDFEHINVM